ncbi:MAG: S-layer homology domain-containing protein [Evtepia gabavorous]
MPGIAGAVDLDRFTEGMLLEQGAEMPFLDVRPQDWYAKGVTELFERGLLQGITPDRFGPDRPAQRAAVVTMIYRLAGEPPGSGPTGFSDVPLDAWYGKAVRWAEGIGIARERPRESFSRPRRKPAGVGGVSLPLWGVQRKGCREER